MIDIIIISLLILLVILLLICIILISRNKDNNKDLVIKNGFDMQNERIDFLTKNINEKIDNFSQRVKESNEYSRTRGNETKNEINELFNALKRDISNYFNSMNVNMESRISSLTQQMETTLTNIRTNITTSIKSLEEENNKKLKEIQDVVDEKLQKTLEGKLRESFSLVNENLEKVYRSIGEMSTIAEGVGDLKKVLVNVKTKGILGEIQLENILSQILAPEQYDINVETKKGSGAKVEFAIKLPGDGNSFVYLPIDAKFPQIVYENLMNAYDSNNKDEINKAIKELSRRIKDSAKEISEKYIDSPRTTEFAIMFLPFEGLYAEVVRCGLIEDLQVNYKINIAGPTTMAALLNSLQMGFKTLAIQKRSSEVWELLATIKTEFGNFSNVLSSAQKKINQASEDLDKLVGVRTRSIQKRLDSVSKFSEIEINKMLPSEE